MLCVEWHSGPVGRPSVRMPMHNFFVKQLHNVSFFYTFVTKFTNSQNRPEKMRTIGWFVFSCLIGTFLVCCLSGCESCSGGEGMMADSTKQDVTLVTDSVSWSDTCHYGRSKGICSIVADFPVGDDDMLERSICRWIDRQLGSRFGGNRGDSEQMLRFYGLSMMDTLRTLLSEHPMTRLSLRQTWELRKVYETDKYVTYIGRIYSNLGGTHLPKIAVGATFSKDEGRQLDWSMFSQTNKEGFRHLIQRGLMTYFGSSSDGELCSHLHVDEMANYDFEFPMPQCPPCFLKQGIFFIYQLGEIAVPAKGLPQFVVPFNAIKPFLTSNTARLIVSGNN